jgi:hypothetical protein
VQKERRTESIYLDSVIPPIRVISWTEIPLELPVWILWKSEDSFVWERALNIQVTFVQSFVHPLNKSSDVHTGD